MIINGTIAKGEIFSQQFIPKLLDGTKRRTSRPCKALNLNYPMRAYENEAPEQWLARWNCKPKYRPGDVIYVRETWQKQFGIYWYKATPICGNAEPPQKWIPSIHMPFEAARIFLRVTDVKAQRLEDVTEQDAIEDGFEITLGYDAEAQVYYAMKSALENFTEFWLNQYGTDKPWMWVYYFEPISKEALYEQS